MRVFARTCRTAALGVLTGLGPETIGSRKLHSHLPDAASSPKGLSRLGPSGRSQCKTACGAKRLVPSLTVGLSGPVFSEEGTSMSRTRIVVTAFAVASFTLSGSVAHADTKSAQDPRGDASQAADITKVTVNNGDRTLSIKVKLAKATVSRTHLIATMTSAAEGGPTYIARTVVVAPNSHANPQASAHAQRTGATLERLPDGATEPTTVECAGIKATLSSGRNGQSSIRIPQACFGEDAGTLLVDVATVTPAGDEVVDEVPSTLRVRQG